MQLNLVHSHMCLTWSAYLDLHIIIKLKLRTRMSIVIKWQSGRCYVIHAKLMLFSLVSGSYKLSYSALESASENYVTLSLKDLHILYKSTLILDAELNHDV